MRNKIKKIIGGLFSLITAAILVIAIIVFVSVTVARSRGEAPRVLGFTLHIVVTGSMSPDIEVGDMAIAKKTDIDKIRVGDDIVFVSEDPDLSGIMIVHRVVSVSDDGSFVTKGINNDEQDKYPAKDVIGKVILVSPFLGKVFSGVAGGKNFVFAAAIIVILIIVVLQIINVVIEIKKRKKGEISDKDKERIRNEVKAELLNERNNARSGKDGGSDA